MTLSPSVAARPSTWRPRSCKLPCGSPSGHLLPRRHPLRDPRPARLPFEPDDRGRARAARSRTCRPSYRGELPRRTCVPTVERRSLRLSPGRSLRKVWGSLLDSLGPDRRAKGDSVAHRLDRRHRCRLTTPMGSTPGGPAGGPAQEPDSDVNAPYRPADSNADLARRTAPAAAAPRSPWHAIRGYEEQRRRPTSRMGRHPRADQGVPRVGGPGLEARGPRDQVELAKRWSTLAGVQTAKEKVGAGRRHQCEGPQPTGGRPRPGETCVSRA